VALWESSLPGAVEIIATDLNQSMLDFAVTQPIARNLSWQKADAIQLPFEDQTFDAVVCQFGVMFFPDKRAGCGEAHRVLKPGGRFVFNVWDRIEANEFARVVSEAVAALFPEDPPGFLARIPHGYYDTDPIREDLQQVGFSSVTVETAERRSRAASHRDPAMGYCQGTPLRGEIEA
jgi:SAM-dependent methyltransferase